MTIVTAVDPKYKERLERNIALWMKTPGLREQQFIVFVNGFEKAADRGFLASYPNVRVIRWDYPFPEATRREFMLACFVFGPAKYVRTKYWMKLDADCRPVKDWWEWPEINDQTVISQNWSVTRMKGDPDVSRHWFHRLDDVFSPTTPYFERQYDPILDHRVRHGANRKDKLVRRFNSFCQIEKTEFTRRIARCLIDNNKGRMAIPSQDTTTWYCAVLWKEPFTLVNMRRFFKN
jgi:hypothetical protein